MPYIEVKDRKEVAAFGPREAATVGELNFVITTVVNTYLKKRGLKYQTINDILGALEGAKQEFYRRVAAPYEDKKKAENGDVYGSEDANGARPVSKTGVVGSTPTTPAKCVTCDLIGEF